MTRRWGWEVLAATTGSEALQLVEGSPHLPDVIVADYRLGDNETGLKAIHDIHGVCGISVPAIVLTGDTSPERIVECQQSGFRLVHKPINACALQKVLAEMWE
ncbi:MAG: response regulator [Rhodospirillales bacterium]|nr:response regulator [Rhodospirillales bacterium]